jgi:hypothetical protein
LAALTLLGRSTPPTVGWSTFFQKLSLKAVKKPAFLQRAPGLKLLRTVGKGPIRGMWRIDQFGYIVSGTEVFRFDKGNNVQFIGNVTGTGPVSMADNGFQLFIACNGPSFIYNLNKQLVGNCRA